MRTPEEIWFRLRQEAANLYLWTSPPSKAAEAQSPLRVFPNPSEVAASVRKTAWARELVATAGRILEGHLPLLGIEVEVGGKVAWRRDYLRGIETPAAYFRRIPYLDVERAGDHKLIWEISRHQYLVLMAQASLIAGEDRYSQYVFDQLEDWWKENPFQGGINWASALEVAFRALSWIWIYHLIGSRMPVAFRSRFLTELSRHGYHLEYNLSIYFSPNTHLLGEAVALHAIGALFPRFRRAASWQHLGRRVVLEELEKQMQADGSHFEHSTYYHVYAVDLFVLHHLIEALPDTGRLNAMAGFLASVTGLSGVLPFLGDDDGGRVFHPFGPRNRFARATLATCSVLLKQRFICYEEEDLFGQATWWIAAKTPATSLPRSPFPGSRWFKDSGIVAMSAADTHIVLDAGTFGSGNAGHSHSDTLSLVIRQGETEILIDPGTYTYVGDPEWRNTFRGSAAHNTIRVDGRDQADPAGPFRWLNKPIVQVHEWRTTADTDYVSASCSYAGIRHQRQVWFTKPDLVVILDTIHGSGEHEIEQFWHPGESVTEIEAGRWRIGEATELAVSDRTQGCIIEGWRSVVLGSKKALPVIRVAGCLTLPAHLATVIRIGGRAAQPIIQGNSVLVGECIY